MKYAAFRNLLAGVACASFMALALTAGAQQNRAKQGAAKDGYSTFTVDLHAFDATNMPKYGLKYFPKLTDLTPQKPVDIHKEPKYQGTPKYATFRLGNGPNSLFVVAIDEPEGGESHIYVDANHNGDLTDDGNGAWTTKDGKNGAVSYKLDNCVLRASYGTDTKETGHAPYALAFYYRSGQDKLIYWRQSARVGIVTVNGKPHKALLVENDSDGVYSKPLNYEGKPANGGPQTLDVWLLLDLDDVGKIGMGTRVFDIRAPFVIKGTNYEVKVSADGSRIKLMPTTRAVVNPVPEAPPAPPVLANGKDAPDFTVDTLTGGTLKLSDFKGKVIVLDFWATWCGPCNASMPHLQRVYDGVKAQDVVVLGVCVADERQAYQQWIAERSKRFTFPLLFDPAGRNDAKSISRNLFGVTGIPTTFVIDKEGKVAASIVGFGGDDDKRIEEALAKLNVHVATASASAAH